MDRVYVAGTVGEASGREDQAHLGWLEDCHGEPGEAALPVSGASTALGMSDSGDSIWVAGATEGTAGDEAFLVEVSATGLSKLSEASAPTQGPEAKLRRAAVQASSAWLAGSVGTAPDAPLWIARVVSGGPGCSAVSTETGEVRAVALVDDGVVVVLDRDTKMHIARFDDANCAPPSCGRQPEFVSGPLALSESTFTSARDARAIDRTLYITGVAQRPTGDPLGFVTEVNVDSGELGASVEIDGPGTDILFGLAVDSQRLTVVGTRGGAGLDDLARGSGMMASVSLPLAGANPSESIPLLSTTRALSVSSVDSRTYILAVREGGGVVAVRCDDGEC